MWESDADEEDEEPDYTAGQRMKALAASYSVLPDWESVDGWIDLLSRKSVLPDSPVAETPAEQSNTEESLAADAWAEETTSDECSWDDEIEVEEAQVVCAVVPVAAAPSAGSLLKAEADAEALDAGACVGEELAVDNVGVADIKVSLNQKQSDVYSDTIGESIVVGVYSYDDEEIVSSLSMPDFFFLCSPTFLLPLYTLSGSQLEIPPQTRIKISNLSSPKSHELDAASAFDGAGNDKLNMAMRRFSKAVAAKRARLSEHMKTTTASHPFPMPR